MKRVAVTTPLYQSLVFQKAMMAVSGIVLFGFVFAHMLGNLKVYQGPEALNGYAHFLRTVGSPEVPAGGILWMARAILLHSVGIHAASAYSVSVTSRAARPIPYQRHQDPGANYASRTMRIGGIILFLFIIFHLLHLTAGRIHPDYLPSDVYHNVVVGFQSLPTSLFYIVAQLALGMHLYHGLYSLFQSLGIANPRFNALRRRFALVFSCLIAAGNVSIPLAVLSGIVS